MSRKDRIVAELISLKVAPLGRYSGVYQLSSSQLRTLLIASYFVLLGRRRTNGLPHQ